MATPISGEQQTHQQPRWNSFLSKLLADLILDQFSKGNNSFSNKAWNSIHREFYKRSGLKWDKEHLKNKFAVLKRQYAVVKLLIARDDFVFDESSCFLIATVEAWDLCVKEYPDAEVIRTDGCPIYKQFSQIFAEDSMTNGKDETVLETKMECSSEYDDAAAVFLPTPKRRRRGVEDAIANAIFEMAAASKLRTTALEKLRRKFSLAECIRELDRIQGLPENCYFAALEFFNNPTVRETFLSLRSDMRLAWLQWKCNAASPTDQC